MDFLLAKGIDLESRVGKTFLSLMAEAKRVHEIVSPGQEMYPWIQELNLVRAFKLVPDEYSHLVEVLDHNSPVFKGNQTEARKFISNAADAYRSSAPIGGMNGTGWDSSAPSFSERVVDIKMAF